MGFCDTVRVEIFADGLNDPAFTTQDSSEPSNLICCSKCTRRGLFGLPGADLCQMLTGSANVLGAHFIVATQYNTPRIWFSNGAAFMLEDLPT